MNTPAVKSAETIRGDRVSAERSLGGNSPTSRGVERTTRKTEAYPGLTVLLQNTKALLECV